MKSTLLSFVFIALTYFLNAQTQGVSYPSVGRGVATTFVNDYHSLGINNSALGWGNDYDKKVTTGMSEFSLGFYSDSLSSDRLKKLYKAIRTDMKDEEPTEGQWAEQKEFAQDYAESGMAIDLSYNWFGFSFQTKKFGGIAVSVSEHYNWYSKLNAQTSDLIFQGNVSSYFDQLTVVYGTDTTMIANTGTVPQDSLDNVISGTASVPLKLSELTNGSRVQFTWNRHFNFGYGKKLFGNDSTFAVYGGIGGRFIQSMAMYDMISDDDGIRMSSAMSPSYNLDYGSISSINPSNFTEAGFIPKPVGMGYGVDVSASVKMFGKLKIAAAVNNVGSVKYTRNVYSLKDTLVADMSLAGISDYNITDAIEPLLQDGGLFTISGEEEHVVRNAATFRLGASIDLGKILSLGFDFVAPFNRDTPGSLANGVVAFGGDFKPVKWLAISAGYLGGGIYKNNVPVGINFILGGGTYEFGISSRDALSFFLDSSNSISTAFGFARVRF
jgi:hypothetical protein